MIGDRLGLFVCALIDAARAGFSIWQSQCGQFAFTLFRTMAVERRFDLGLCGFGNNHFSFSFKLSLAGAHHLPWARPLFRGFRSPARPVLIKHGARGNPVHTFFRRHIRSLHSEFGEPPAILCGW